jgi:hypothetical protein
MTHVLALEALDAFASLDHCLVPAGLVPAVADVDLVGTRAVVLLCEVLGHFGVAVGAVALSAPVLGHEDVLKPRVVRAVVDVAHVLAHPGLARDDDLVELDAALLVSGLPLRVYAALCL